MTLQKILFLCAILAGLPQGAAAQAGKPRARQWGIPFDGTPGKYNAITDVAGVEVGHVTLISGEKAAAIRTGVTAVWPQGKVNGNVPASWFALNGNGEMTGTAWVDEAGLLNGPIVLTNTYSVGIARDAVIEWGRNHFPPKLTSGDDDAFGLPVVTETFDWLLNNAFAFAVRKEHVFQALDSAAGGFVAEGNVGGGTGMTCFEFKCGIGTSSRKVSLFSKEYTLGVLVQANFAARNELRVKGVPVGQKITDLMPIEASPQKKDGSIIVIIATDAPLLPHQLKRVAKRATIGVGNTGGTGRNSSGDIFFAFSTAIPKAGVDNGLDAWKALPADDTINALFTATIQATEEAVLNALVAGETMEGYRGNKAFAIPHERLRNLLKEYGRVQ